MCDIAANSFGRQSSFSRDQQLDSLSQLSVPELVSAQAAATPSATALTHGRRSLSYHELDRRADRVAHVLRSLGVGPDVVVGLYLDRSLAMIVGALAILKAGGAYLIGSKLSHRPVNVPVEGCAGDDSRDWGVYG